MAANLEELRSRIFDPTFEQPRREEPGPEPRPGPEPEVPIAGGEPDPERTLDLETAREFIFDDGELAPPEEVFEPEPELAMPEASIANLKMRAKVAAADTKKEKLQAFLQEFPEGDLMLVPRREGPPVLAFRENPDAELKELDPSRMTIPETVADLIEFGAQDLGSIAGEIAATLRTRGVSLIGVLGRMFVGGTTGEAAQEVAETVAGFGGDEALSEIAGRSLLKGTVATAGGAIGELTLRPAFNLATGAGVLALRRGASRAQQAAERLGLGKLPLNSLTDNPLIKRLAGQARALTPTLQRYVEEQGAMMVNVMIKHSFRSRKGITNKQALDALVKAEREEMERISNTALRHLHTKKTSLTQAGKQIQAALRDWDEAQQGLITAAYTEARSIAEPVFSLVESKAVAREVLEGVRSNVAMERLPRAAQAAIERGEIRQPTFRINTIPSDVRQVAQKLLLMADAPEPVMSGGKVIPVVDQLRALRQELFDLKEAGGFGASAEARQAARFAKRMYGVVTNAIKEPPTIRGFGNQPTDVAMFREAWDRANTMASDRFEMTEKLIFLNAAKSETPTQLAARLGDLSNPAAGDNIRELGLILPQRAYQDFKAAVISNLMDNPFQLRQALDSAHPTVKKHIFGLNDEGILRNAADAFDRLKSLNMSKAVQDQRKFTRAVGQLISTNKTAEIETLEQIVKRNGGLSGSFGRIVRAGIIDDVVRKSVRFKDGRSGIDPNKLNSALEKLKESGAWRLLDPTERTFLNDHQAVTDLIRMTSDVGASLQGAEAARGVFRMTGAGLRTLAENLGIGAIMTGRGTFGGMINHVLIGTGKKDHVPHSLLVREIGSLSTRYVADLSSSSEILADVSQVFSHETDTANRSRSLGDLLE